MFFKENRVKAGVFNPRTREADAGGSLNSRQPGIAWVTQRNPAWGWGV